jgi:BASS family bile acid:Na+ symporter
MKPIIDLGILLVNVLMMMAVGLDLEPGHFQRVMRQKRALIVSLTASSILLPLLGLALTHLLSLPPHVSAGILLLAACPNGDIVNFYTWLARANIALAVTMTVICCSPPSPCRSFSRFTNKPSQRHSPLRCRHWV